LACFALLNWGPDYMLNIRGARREHDEPVEAKRHATCLGHDRERLQEFFIDGIGFAIDSQPFRHLGLKPLPLQNGIGQFAKTIGKLDTAGIKLKPLRKARITLELGALRLACRVVH
jgi:hypothetical protein